MTVFQWAGALLLLLALLQAILMLRSARQRHQFRLREMRLQSERMELQIRILSSRQRQRELGWQGYRKFIVNKKEPACEDVVSVILKPHDGLPVPDYKAGQHLTFRLQVPGQLKPGNRCYSLSEAPAVSHQDHYRISVKRIAPPSDQPELPPGLVSGVWHDEVATGDLVDVRAPKGTFHLDELSNRPVVLIAGGIGVTPLLSMFRHLANLNSKRDVWLFYGVTHKGQVLNPEELEQAAAAGPNFRLRLAFSDPGPNCEKGRDYQRKGHVDIHWIRQELNLPEIYSESPVYQQPEFYICGPPAMMKSVIGDLEDWQVPAEVIHFEAFGPASVRKLKPAVVEDSQASQTQYRVEFRRSGKTIQWQTNDGSLLESAVAKDILLDCGCRCGDCGTCEIAVIDGEVEYPDKEPQFELQTGNCLTCIGVPKTNLILDA